MSTIVETGEIVTGANSYVSEADITTYASDRGVTLTGVAVLRVQAMDYLESMQFIGTKSDDSQPLQWPRDNAYIDGYLIDSDAIPQLLKDAECTICIAIFQGYNPLAPLTPGIKKQKVGEIEIEYQDGAYPLTTATTIAYVLRKLINGSTANVIKVTKA